VKQIPAIRCISPVSTTTQVVDVQAAGSTAVANSGGFACTLPRAIEPHLQVAIGTARSDLSMDEASVRKKTVICLLHVLLAPEATVARSRHARNPVR
jgi:hypothetical protein